MHEAIRDGVTNKKAVITARDGAKEAPITSARRSSDLRREGAQPGAHQLAEALRLQEQLNSLLQGVSTDNPQTSPTMPSLDILLQAMRSQILTHQVAH